MRKEEMELELLGQPVRGLQFMLRRLAQENPFLPLLTPDGIFGEETLEAVMLYQRELHPPVTGIVDSDLWDDIRGRWLETEQRHGGSRPLRAFPSKGREIAPGEEREFFALPQMMFRLLSRYLTGFVPGDSNGMHDETSVENTKLIQRAAGLPQTGVMDRRTWEMLSRLYEVFVVRSSEEKPLLGGWG